MIMECASDVSVENVEADMPSGSKIGIDVTAILLETCCAYELSCVVSSEIPFQSGERHPPPAQVLEGIMSPYRGPTSL
jgi:hypothetical protein